MAGGGDMLFGGMCLGGSAKCPVLIDGGWKNSDDSKLCGLVLGHGSLVENHF